MKTKKILLATMSVIIIVSVVILTIGLNVSAASYNTGFKSPTANAAGATGDGNGFEGGPTNAYADGGSLATDVDSGTAASSACADATRTRFTISPLACPAAPPLTASRCAWTPR